MSPASRVRPSLQPFLHLGKAHEERFYVLAQMDAFVSRFFLRGLLLLGVGHIETFW